MKFAIIVICILFSVKGHAQSAELANAYFRNYA